METTIINFRTKDWVKKEFFQLCNDQNVTATSRLNDYMRTYLMEHGVIEPVKKPIQKVRTQSVSDWRDDLVTKSF